MNQPLRARRDYDEGSTDAAMIKPVVPSPGLDVPQALDYDAVDAVPSLPQGCNCENDQPVPMGNKLVLICPVCDRTSPYEPGTDVTPDASVSCPRCASSIPLKSFFKSKEGSYIAKTASSMDALFKKVYSLVPREDKQIVLTRSKVDQLYGALQKIRSFCDKVHKEIDS